VRLARWVCSAEKCAGAQRWEGLAAELAVDMARLWSRNLGRDDRLLADTSREVRHSACL